MIQSVENLTLELLDLGLIGFLSRLFRYKSNHFVSDGLWFVWSDQGLLLFLKLCVLFALAVGF